MRKLLNNFINYSFIKREAVKNIDKNFNACDIYQERRIIKDLK